MLTSFCVRPTSINLGERRNCQQTWDGATRGNAIPASHFGTFEVTSTPAARATGPRRISSGHWLGGLSGLLTKRETKHVQLIGRFCFCSIWIKWELARVLSGARSVLRTAWRQNRVLRASEPTAPASIVPLTVPYDLYLPHTSDVDCAVFLLS